MNMMHSIPTIRRSTVVLGAILILETGYFLFSVIYHPLFGGFDTKIVRPYSGFQFKNELTCTVVHSTRDSGKFISTKTAPWLDVRTIQLRGLTTDFPEMAWYNGHWNPLHTTFNDGTYIAFSAEPGSFSNDYFGINKKFGTFMHMVADPDGGIDGNFGAFESVAQKGRCR